jgi:hypothetical protein
MEQDLHVNPENHVNLVNDYRENSEPSQILNFGTYTVKSLQR